MKKAETFLRIFALSFVWIMPVPMAAEVKEDPFKDIEKVKEELWLFAPISKLKREQIAKELSADEFATRESLRQRLMRAPKSWLPHLQVVHDQTDDPEVRASLAQVLGRQEFDELVPLETVIRSILRHGHRNLTSELFAVLPSAPSRRSAESVMAAARLMVKEEEQKAVVESLSSQDALVREAAARMVSALQDDPRETLKTLLNDESSMVRLAVAEMFAEKADPACLQVLETLASGNDLYLRWRAGGILRFMTGGEIDANPLTPEKALALDLNKWRKPGALIAWNAGQPLPLIPLFKENEDLSDWTLARDALVDVPKLIPGKDYLRSMGTGFSVWGSPFQFQNYRLRLEWKFEWEDSTSSGGFSLAKFNAPPPENAADWEVDGNVEIEIKEARSGELYARGDYLLVDGKKAGYPAKKRHLHNERSADWNTLVVEEYNGTLRVWVNGLLQNEATGLSGDLTTFGLRVERTPIDWRSLMLEPLPGARFAPQKTETKPED